MLRTHEEEGKEDAQLRIRGMQRANAPFVWINTCEGKQKTEGARNRKK